MKPICKVFARPKAQDAACELTGYWWMATDDITMEQFIPLLEEATMLEFNRVEQVTLSELEGRLDNPIKSAIICVYNFKRGQKSVFSAKMPYDEIQALCEEMRKTKDKIKA